MRINITQPPDWIQAWEAAAKRAGLSLSEWIGTHCNRALPDETLASLSARQKPGRPAKNTHK
jgi:hypothetical protein